MTAQKISTLLALATFSSSPVLPATPPSHVSSRMISTPSKEPSQRASFRKLKNVWSPTPSFRAKGTYVGQLQERWTFPSDHLPIAMTFDHLHFASWNVLDAEYMSWVTEKNSQGLSRSLIADEHVYIGDSKLTIRDQHVARLVLEMVSHPTHPRSLISLQECSPSLIEELRARLPSHFEIISHRGEAILLDQNHFEPVEAKEVVGVFKNEPNRTLQDVTVKRLDNGQLLRLVNAHLPGDPTKPGRFEFAEYLRDTFDPTLTTIAMGDMNFDELEMADALREAFPLNSPFSLHSPYCTNIAPITFQSKAIDHFFVYSPEKAPIRLNAPDEVIAGLNSIVLLLHDTIEETRNKPLRPCRNQAAKPDEHPWPKAGDLSKIDILKI